MRRKICLQALNLYEHIPNCAYMQQQKLSGKRTFESQLPAIYFSQLQHKDVMSLRLVICEDNKTFFRLYLKKYYLCDQIILHQNNILIPWNNDSLSLLLGTVYRYVDATVSWVPPLQASLLVNLPEINILQDEK